VSDAGLIDASTPLTSTRSVCGLWAVARFLENIGDTVLVFLHPHLFGAPINQPHQSGHPITFYHWSAVCATGVGMFLCVLLSSFYIGVFLLLRLGDLRGG